jgi:hypothetical protein
MSYFEDGLRRGMDGKGTPQGPMEGIFSNDKQRAEATRGHEAGLAARAHGEAVRDALEEAKDSDADDGYDYSDDSTGSSGSTSTYSYSESKPNALDKIWNLAGGVWIVAILLGRLCGPNFRHDSGSQRRFRGGGNVWNPRTDCWRFLWPSLAYHAADHFIRYFPLLDNRPGSSMRFIINPRMCLKSSL